MMGERISCIINEKIEREVRGLRRQLTVLSTWSKATISLDELSELFYEKGQSYEQLAAIILEMEYKQLLEPVKAAGRTTRNPSLAFRYRIVKAHILGDFQTELHQYNQQFHSAIRLDSYYTSRQERFASDLPFLEKIDRYIKEHGFPEESVPAPERSAELVGDEKWIDENGGKELLERIRLWDRLQIVPVSDPLMLAVNPKVLQERTQYHLIVENKTTYQALLPTLRETGFSSLIYGSGNKIVKSIEQFEWQLPMDEAEHTIYYFGDIDRSGFTIWHSLTKRRRVLPAVPFYEACLTKEPFVGKMNQRKDREAVEAFVAQWAGGKRIEQLLEDGKYYPQEILTSVELRKIWREWSWRLLNGMV